MIAKHVHATVIASLHRYSHSRDEAWPETEREAMLEVLATCLPRQVAPYLFDGAGVRTAPVDFSPLRTLVADNAAALTSDVERVFAQGWPDADADVVAPDVLRNCVDGFADGLEQVVSRLRRRLRWALDQIRR